MKPAEGALPSSFRDPAGFLFTHDGTLYRQINKSYSEHFYTPIDSGLYDTLTRQKLLIPHTECESQKGLIEDAYKIIQP